MASHESDCAQHIAYRPIRPSDLEALQEIHASLFPIRYEPQFFLNVVNGRDIISWAAVDSSRLDGKADELIGFVTARIVIPSQAEMKDILRCDSSDKNLKLVYILTLGVTQQYRNLGIASSLVQEVINYASSIPECRAVYLHVIAYNRHAILFYKKMAFRRLRRLPYFYYINDQHFDAYLYAHYVNGGRSPCSALERSVDALCSPYLDLFEVAKGTFTFIYMRGQLQFEQYWMNFSIAAGVLLDYDIHLIAAVATYLRSLFTSLTRLWKHGDEVPARPKCREANSLLSNSNRTILGAESSALQCESNN